MKDNEKSASGGMLDSLVGLPRCEKTQYGQEVSGPDQDGEIEIDVDGCDYVWLSEKDLRMMLRRFDQANAKHDTGGRSGANDD